MLKYLAEYIGTFIVVTVILGTFTIKDKLSIYAPLVVGLGLATAIYIFDNTSGAHFNPVVTIIMVLNKSLNIKHALPYIISQILGSLTALIFYIYFFKIYIKFIRLKVLYLDLFMNYLKKLYNI